MESVYYTLYTSLIYIYIYSSGLKFGSNMVQSVALDPKIQLYFVNTDLGQRLEEPFSVNFNLIFGSA